MTPMIRPEQSLPVALCAFILFLSAPAASRADAEETVKPLSAEEQYEFAMRFFKLKQYPEAALVPFPGVV